MYKIDASHHPAAKQQPEICYHVRPTMSDLTLPISIDYSQLAALCERWHIRKLSFLDQY